MRLLHTFDDSAGGRPLNRQELANGSGDWIETWGSTTPKLVFDGLTSAQFPSEVFNIANYLPPDDWFPVITSMFPPGLT